MMNRVCLLSKRSFPWDPLPNSGIFFPIFFPTLPKSSFAYVLANLCENLLATLIDLTLVYDK